MKEKSLSYALCLCFEWDYVREFPPTYWINKRQTITTKPKMSSFCHFFLLLLLTWLGWIAKRSVIDFVGTDFHEIALQAHQPTILTYFLISFNSPVRVAQLSISELFADLFHFSVTAPLLIRSLLAYDDFSWRIPRTAQKFELFTAKKKNCFALAFYLLHIILLSLCCCPLAILFIWWPILQHFLANNSSFIEIQTKWNLCVE